MKHLLVLLFVASLFTFCSEDNDWDPKDIKEVVLDNTNFVYHIKNGTIHQSGDLPEDIQENCIMNEPWCTDLPALCGNYVITDKTDFSDFDSIPNGDYENWCDEMELNKIIVFKLEDASYALVKIVDDNYTSSETMCEHEVTLEIVYPALVGLEMQ